MPAITATAHQGPLNGTALNISEQLCLRASGEDKTSSTVKASSRVPLAGHTFRKHHRKLYVLGTVHENEIFEIIKFSAVLATRCFLYFGDRIQFIADGSARRITNELRERHNFFHLILPFAIRALVS